MSTKHSQRGVSLTELMVTLVIGSIIAAGVSQMFVSSKQSYRLQERMNSMQENARFAMQVLDYSIRMADHWGGIPGGDINGTPAAVGIGSCNSAWIFNAEEGIRGYEGTGATAPLPSGCLNDNDYEGNSDILVVRYADPGFVTNAGLGTSPATDVFVRTSIGGDGSFVYGGDATVSALADSDGTYNYPYAVDVFFIRQCSVQGGATCTPADDGGTPVPTLTRLSLDDTGALIQQPLIEGVEQMQFEYGLDTNGDFTADVYATAATIDGNPGLKWENVTSVRVSLIVRSLGRDIAHNDANTYSMVGGFSYTPAAADQDFQRRLYTHIVQIRNRSRG